MICASPATAIRWQPLVLCGAHRADRVMVGGDWRVIDGAIPGLDVADLIRRHSAAARAMQAG